MLELRAKIHGRVHGVGFRATTLRFARELQLKGTVSNSSDGTVEIIAQGEKKVLEELISMLSTVFGKRHIEKIDVHYTEPEQLYSGFSVE